MPSSPKVNRNESIKRRQVREASTQGTNITGVESGRADRELRKMGKKKAERVYGDWRKRNIKPVTKEGRAEVDRIWPGNNGQAEVYRRSADGMGVSRDIAKIDATALRRKREISSNAKTYKASRGGSYAKNYFKKNSK